MSSGLLSIDYAVIVVYFAALIAMSWYLGRGQETQEDYYVAGRDLPWWAVGLSTAATQTSAIGFVSIPAFVAMKEGGGLKILQGELVLPLALIFVMVVLIPFFRRLNLVSIYEYLELRFSPGVKYLIAGVFLLSRGLATAIGLYMTGIVCSTVFGTSLWPTIAIVGVVVLIYDTIGGMKAVVYSDVVQMVVLLVGAGLIVVYAVVESGGVGEAVSHIGGALSGRVRVLDFGHHGFGDGGEFSFLPQFVGGFFLLASYYGCDQTQTQRELSAANLTETRRSLVFNAYFRFPLSLLYCAIGLVLGAYVVVHTDFAGRVMDMGKVDYLVPMFVMEVIPAGVRAVIFVAILAAAMSSLDSSINSLSASTQHDFVRPLLFGDRKIDDRKFLRVSKAITVVWGTVITALAMFVGEISETVIESIGVIGSVFYGPTLAAFAVGVLSRRTSARTMAVAVLLGVVANICLYMFFDGVFWMWWNATGCVVAVVVVMVVNVLFSSPPLSETQLTHVMRWGEVGAEEKTWIPTYVGLIAYSIFMVVICALIPVLLT